MIFTVFNAFTETPGIKKKDREREGFQLEKNILSIIDKFAIHFVKLKIFVNFFRFAA